MVGRPRKNPEPVEYNASVELSPAPPAASPKPDGNLFPLRLVKNYRPVGDFKIGRPVVIAGEITGEVNFEEPTADDRKKVVAGTRIKLPIEEAKLLVAKRIAERADEIG